MNKVEGLQYILEQQLCEALGLDAGEVRSIRLTFAANTVAQADIILFLDKEHLNKVIPILKQYELVPRKEEIHAKE